jgi:hypothetical protein
MKLTGNFIGSAKTGTGKEITAFYLVNNHLHDLLVKRTGIIPANAGVQKFSKHIW